MTPLDVIILAFAVFCVLVAELHGHRRTTRARGWADHWHTLYMESPRTSTQAVERALERGRSEGYQECLDDIEADRPALQAQTAVMTVAPSVGPLFAREFGPPEWNDPAHVPAHIITDMEPQTRAIEAPKPGELTVEFERNLVTMLAEMEATRIRADQALQLGTGTVPNRKDSP